MSSVPSQPKRRQYFRVPLIELVRPDSFWPYPITVEMAFETLRWMVETGSKPEYDRQQWGKCAVEELLNGGSVRGCSRIDPIKSLADLRKRFHYAVLLRPESQEQIDWRKDNGIDVNSTVTVKAPVYMAFEGAKHLGMDSEAAIIDQLDAVLDGGRGVDMAVSLNPSHPTLRCVERVEIAIHPAHGFSFFLAYGHRVEEKMRSSWSDLIAHTRPGETFLDTFARARDAFECLVHGKANNADLEDMRSLYRSEYIFEQVEALHDRAPEAFAPTP